MNNQYEVASKDCRICNRRRIKCDRRVPWCGKCQKRSLNCSGYGVILKWDQGVASRGILKGKALPLRKTESKLPIPTLTPSSGPQEALAGEPIDSADGNFISSNLEISYIPMPLLSGQLQDFEQRRLLHHYDHIVAPNMAWADCPENPWRNIIIPFALHSPPLLNAVLAFAAKHINAVAFSHSAEVTSLAPARLSDTFQQHAMKLLVQEIRQFATKDLSHPPPNVDKESSRIHRNSLLATMLVLCNVETVWPDSQVWQVHLDAARTVIASHEISTRTRIPDTTSTFLEQELFIANTFASTTNFNNSSSINNFQFDDHISRPNSIFIEFLRLIEMVTSLERQALTHAQLMTDSGVSPSGLQKLFENARSRTLEMGKMLQVSGSTDYLHLSRTVNCFYHAGLIYSHRALLKHESLGLSFSDEKKLRLRTSKAELFRALCFAETKKPTLAQDLVWPLFIAGTEATQEDEQRIVVAKLQQAMSETGFSNCQHALTFLKAFWQRTARGDDFGNELDWIAFARQWTGQGRPFLVF